MAVQTAAYIRRVFSEMLAETSLSHITVTSLTKRCGISRNCFYYHYDDIPALLQETIVKTLDSVLDTIPADADDLQRLQRLTEFSLAHRSEILHIHNSSERNLVEEALIATCNNLADRFLAAHYSKLDLDSPTGRALHKGITYVTFGVVMDWLNQQMSYDLVEEVSSLHRAAVAATQYQDD